MRIELLKMLSVIATVLVVVVGTSGCNEAAPFDPDPPGGGQLYVMDLATFTSDVEPILTARGCDTIACHGGGIRGTFELSPVSNKDITLDYVQATLQVDGYNTTASMLLQKPLDEAAGGLVHTGGAAFTNTSDTDYQTILAWIEAGEFK